MQVYTLPYKLDINPLRKVFEQDLEAWWICSCFKGLLLVVGGYEPM